MFSRFIRRRDIGCCGRSDCIGCSRACSTSSGTHLIPSCVGGQGCQGRRGTQVRVQNSHLFFDSSWFCTVIRSESETMSCKYHYAGGVRTLLQWRASWTGYQRTVRIKILLISQLFHVAIVTAYSVETETKPCRYHKVRGLAPFTELILLTVTHSYIESTTKPCKYPFITV